MQMNQTIEDIITRELRDLCSTCAHVNACIYRQGSSKAIIQCELFDLDPGERTLMENEGPSGLCANCDHASYCNLPGRKLGVWRCNEFR